MQTLVEVIGRRAVTVCPAQAEALLSEWSRAPGRGVRGTSVDPWQHSEDPHRWAWRGDSPDQVAGTLDCRIDDIHVGLDVRVALVGLIGAGP